MLDASGSSWIGRIEPLSVRTALLDLGRGEALHFGNSEQAATFINTGPELQFVVLSNAGSAKQKNLLQRSTAGARFS